MRVREKIRDVGMNAEESKNKEKSVDELQEQARLSHEDTVVEF